MGNIVELGGSAIGNGKQPFFIAEIGANHNGDMELARELIRAAAHAGASAVKFQSWSPETLFSAETYERVTGLHEQVAQYAMSANQQRDAQAYAHEQGIMFASTPFSNYEVDLLDEMAVPFFKIASMDLTNKHLLKYAASKGRPIILSTGMGKLDEVDQAVATIKATGNKDLVILHCVALYPAPAETINLRNIPMLQERFGVPVGFSDHTIGNACALGAIALGASLVEKHFTIDTTAPGWDQSISATPKSFTALVEEGHTIWEATGITERNVGSQETEKSDFFRRSIVLTRDMVEGETITLPDLDFKRPGTGITPNDAETVLGRKLNRNIAYDHVLRWGDLA